MQSKTERILKTNTNKTMLLTLPDHRTLFYCINEQNIQVVHKFVKLGSLVSAGGGIKFDVA